MKPKDLSAREGKVLRYVCGFTPGSYYWDRSAMAVKAEMCVIPKSPVVTDLPRTVMQALKTLKQLEKYGLIEQAEEGYKPLPDGRKLIAAANKAGMWRSSRD